MGGAVVVTTYWLAFLEISSLTMETIREVEDNYVTDEMDRLIPAGVSGRIKTKIDHCTAT